MPGLFGVGFSVPDWVSFLVCRFSCYFGRFILLLLFYLVHFHHVRLFKRRPSGGPPAAAVDVGQRGDTGDRRPVGGGVDLPRPARPVVVRMGVNEAMRGN